MIRQSILWLNVVLLMSALFFSCERDNSEPLSIHSVWTNDYNVANEQITGSLLDKWVRLEGSGFTGLRKLYCNGKEVGFNPVHVSENYIVFRIPTELPTGSDVTDEQVRNTIQAVTTKGSVVYKDFIFRDATKIPRIDAVSCTMPFAGDAVTITGINLSKAKEVFFPGDVKVAIKSVSATEIVVETPANVDRQQSGAIRIVIDGEDYLTPPYLFYQAGIFLQTTTDPEVPMSGGTGYATLAGDALKNLTQLPNNPAYAISIPATAKDLAVGTGNDDKGNTGWLRFAMVKAIQKVMNNPASKISTTTNMNNLAIQFELYMNQPWKSGVLSYRLDVSKGGAASATTYNFGWWAVSNAVVPYDFKKQWQTVSIPLSYFKAGSTGQPLTTVRTYLQDNATVNSALAFVNFYQNYPSVPLVQFQLLIANLRLVPLTQTL
ncbi:hypothetical protein BWI97_26110 [Siphonobacter sp. BAB-5405]|nr:hypothetical protein BWI97_26110 [Siphonobacter sp. BAB-5405]